MLQHGKRFLHHKDSSVTLGCAARLAHVYMFEGHVVSGFLAAFGFPRGGVIAVRCFFSPDCACLLSLVSC